jgi:hypothetical protein
VISPAGTTCFAPQLAARARDVVVAFSCLGAGAFIARVDGKDGGGPLTVTHLGPGSQLSLAHDGLTATYAITADDGHRVTASDVVVVDLRAFVDAQAPTATRLLSTRIERAPGVSDVRADGSVVLSFVGDDDVVFVSWRGGR